eukprot:TRINITY_DN1847_c0_g1_i1.p1 TRINITY_DN1847_c0_g1~~TRINITY_DN1847_c0_g1_i1.p1  ORF type:complete len:132 (-),score=23.14 TRINITY_DN1847_c0_g1_i1:285-680(-)
MMLTLIGYPIIFSGVFVPLGISRVLTGAGIDIPIEYTWISVKLFVSTGFFNAIYCGIIRKIFRNWKIEFNGTTIRGKLSKSRSKSKSKTINKPRSKTINKPRSKSIQRDSTVRETNHILQKPDLEQYKTST